MKSHNDTPGSPRELGLLNYACAMNDDDGSGPGLHARRGGPAPVMGHKEIDCARQLVLQQRRPLRRSASGMCALATVLDGMVRRNEPCSVGWPSRTRERDGAGRAQQLRTSAPVQQLEMDAGAEAGQRSD